MLKQLRWEFYLHVVYNFLEINMDTWEINSDDDGDDIEETDDENDQYISR